MSDPHVAIDALVKIYPGNGRPAVDRVSLSLPRGEMLALLGPSGCGKTTILRMVAGLITPTSGAILVNGRDVSATPSHLRNFGMVFQSYALFPHMTIAGNIAFGLEMRKIGRAERDARVAKALDLVKLSGLGERRPNQLSGGQQQRAALARSLVIEPELLLFDEPLSNLDAKLREELREEIREIQNRTGVTSIFVTHDQDEALSMADRLAVMSEGRLEQIGTPRDIFEQPRSPFVASFIGAGNFLAGRVTGPGRVRLDGTDDVELDIAHGAPVGAQIKLVIRPHRLLPVEAGPGRNRFQGHVSHVVYRGQALTLTVESGGLRLQADLPTHSGRLPAKGDAITLAVAPEDVTPIGEAAP